MPIVILCLTMLLAGCVHAPATSPSVTDPMQPDLIIRGGMLIDGTGAPPRQVGSIEIRDGSIVAIHDGDAVVPGGVPVIDATGSYIIPGLTDAHVHLGSGGLSETRVPVERLLRQFLFYGVTNIVSLGGTGGSAAAITDLRRRSERGEIVAPHIYATGEAITLPGSHPIGTFNRVPAGEDPETYDWSPQGIEAVETVFEAVEVVRDHAAAGMDAIKIIVESGPDPFGDDHPQMPLEMITAVVEESNQYGLPVFAHVSSPDEVADSLAGGVHGLAHGVIGPAPKQRDWERMQEQGIFLIPTLSLAAPTVSEHWSGNALDDPFVVSGVDRQTLDSLEKFRPPVDLPRAEKQRHWKSLLGLQIDAHRNGVKLALGSDTNMPFVFPGHSVHKELEFLVEAGMSPSEAITAATLHPAALLRKEAAFGTIEAGKRADIVILERNPLEEITNTRTIQMVILEGDVIDRETLLDPATAARDTMPASD